MLDHLAASGHVERARLERDRRVVVSRLSPRGRREIEAKREKWQGRWEQALADVDADESARCHARAHTACRRSSRTAPKPLL